MNPKLSKFKKAILPTIGVLFLSLSIFLSAVIIITYGNTCRIVGTISSYSQIVPIVEKVMEKDTVTPIEEKESFQAMISNFSDMLEIAQEMVKEPIDGFSVIFPNILIQLLIFILGVCFGIGMKPKKKDSIQEGLDDTEGFN